MQPVQVVKAFMAAMEAQDFDQAASYLADGFTFAGSLRQGENKEGFIALNKAVRAAIPDYSYNLSDVRSAGETVGATIRVTGTHTGDLCLPRPDVPVIPATGRPVALPQEQQLYHIHDGKIHLLRIDEVPNGGLAGLLEQIGFVLPEHRNE